MEEIKRLPKIIWKPMSGYEGLYEMSNSGSIRPADYKEEFPGLTCLSAVILQFLNKDRDYVATLEKNGKREVVNTSHLWNETFSKKVNNQYKGWVAI